MKIFEISGEEKELIKFYKGEFGMIAVGSVAGYLALATESAPVMTGSISALGLATAIGAIRTWRSMDRQPEDDRAQSAPEN